MLLLVTSVLTLLVPVVYLLALFAGALYLGIELYLCNQIWLKPRLWDGRTRCRWPTFRSPVFNLAPTIPPPNR